MSASSGMDRLADAMSAWLAFRTDAAQSPEAFLAAHEPLRDLLEPMLREPEDEVAAAGSIGPGAVFGDFQLLAEIGRGGMGIVYRARQRSLDRQVAVKLLPPGASLQPRALARFRREAATAARFEHPGIVAVHAVGEQHGLHWFAMELVTGEPLDRFAVTARAGNRVGWVRTAVDIVAQVAEALQFAHDVGVVHRDIKPSNVLVRPGGAAVVTDFGLARTAGLPSLSQTGEFAGTPDYVSPEQARGDQDVDARADVFSLGVTLYELLTQELPFRGDSTRAVLDNIQRREPRAPSHVDRSLPRDLDAVVLKALDKDKGRRYQSAAMFADDLRRFLAGEPVRAAPVRAPQRLWRWARREPLRSALLTATALTALLAGLLWQNRSAMARGRAELSADRVELLLLQATIAPMTAAGNQGKQQLLDEALRLSPDDPYIVGLVAQARSGGKDAKAGIGCIDAFAAASELPLSLRRLRQRLQRDPGEELLPPPADALDHFLCGGAAMRRWAGGDKAAATAAMQHMRAAVALSSRPRSMFYIGLNQAARALDDWTTVRTAGDALVHFWPDSAVSHCHRGLAWLGEDLDIVRREAERSLELAPDNFLGLWLLAQAAGAAGDPGAAAALQQKARQLHPDQAGFLDHQAAHDRETKAAEAGK